MGMVRVVSHKGNLHMHGWNNISNSSIKFTKQKEMLWIGLYRFHHLLLQNAALRSSWDGQLNGSVGKFIHRCRAARSWSWWALSPSPAKKQREVSRGIDWWANSMISQLGVKELLIEKSRGWWTHHVKRRCKHDDAEGENDVVFALSRCLELKEVALWCRQVVHCRCTVMVTAAVASLGDD